MHAQEGKHNTHFYRGEMLNYWGKLHLEKVLLRHITTVEKCLTTLLWDLVEKYVSFAHVYFHMNIYV